MSSNNSSWSHHSYGYYNKDESHSPSKFSSFSSGEESTLGGFGQPLCAHEGHYYLRPSAFDIEDGVTLLKH